MVRLLVSQYAEDEAMNARFAGLPLNALPPQPMGYDARRPRERRVGRWIPGRFLPVEF